METHNVHNEIKSISLYNLDKKENNLISKIRKPMLQVPKCSLSRKNTNKLIIKNIFDDKKIRENLKLKESQIIKKNNKSPTLKTNYSVSEVKNKKDREINSLGTKKKAIYTINIQLDS